MYRSAIIFVSLIEWGVPSPTTTLFWAGERKRLCNETRNLKMEFFNTLNKRSTENERVSLLTYKNWKYLKWKITNDLL